MTGVQLLQYLQRRLAETNLALEADRVNELYDYLTEGRNELLQAFSLAAPVVVRQVVTMTVDLVDTRQWNLPVGTPDPYRVLLLRELTTGEPFDPSQTLDVDNGDYEWLNLRSIRLSADADPGDGVVAVYVPSATDITAATTEAQVGLPTTCHRAIGKFAAVLALTADEESDAKNAMALFEREMDKLERMYSDYDMSGGFSLRAAIMESTGSLNRGNLY